MQRNLMVFVLFLIAMPLVAQKAELHGKVADPSGALVPGATVTVTCSEGKQASATADSIGQYTMRGLATGHCTVLGNSKELATASAIPVTLHEGVQTLDLQLVVTAVTQQVTVADDTGGLSTESGSNASALSLKGADLDALSDNPDDLQADLQALAGPSAGPNGGSMFIDGFSGGELPPKESIREIRVNQDPFSPEYDTIGYGRIDILTKPGSDRYRATVDYNTGNSAWNSRNPYSTTKAPFLLNEFEGTGGGPLTKRSSFILDAQRNMVDNGSVTNALIIDPTTFTEAPFNASTTTVQRLTRAVPRVDYALNENNTLTLRYGWTHADIQDAGIGAFDLASRGFHTRYTNQTAQAGETAVMGKLINEVRFQFYRAAIQQDANSSSPATLVLGAFNGGGAQIGQSADAQNSYELQNYTSLLLGRHFLKFGVRLRGQTDDNTSPQDFNGAFTFGGVASAPELDANNQLVLDPSGQPVEIAISSIEQYRRTLLFQSLGYSPAQVRAIGGGATQFSMSAGAPETAASQIDVALFVGDEWRVRPNLTVGMGLRYEAQTNIHDWRDVAPRLALAWSPRSPSGKQSDTVIRAGVGLFYTRFALGNTVTAMRYNGVVQQQYTLANPDFFPSLPSSSVLAQAQTSQIVQQVSPQVRAPYIIQSALSLERQLPAHTTLAITYTNSHGVHMLRSNDINAPEPGTYDPNVPGSGVFPLGPIGPRFLMQSDGLYNQNQLIANAKTRVGSTISLFGFYVLNKAMSNTDGVTTFPANPYNLSGEYGPAATDIRQQGTFGGSVSLRWNLRISPFLTAQSGAPFDITTGSDLYGTTLLNARPGFATDRNKPGVVSTSYGILDPSPTVDERLVPRNYGRGPAPINFNLRLAKTIGFGAEGGKRDGGAGPGGGNVTATANAAAGKRIGTLIAAPSSGRRYNLTVSVTSRNILNHTNPGLIVGNISSPLFGESNQIGRPPNGEGFYETANNRRTEIQIRLSF